MTPNHTYCNRQISGNESIFTRRHGQPITHPISINISFLILSKLQSTRKPGLITFIPWELELYGSGRPTWIPKRLHCVIIRFVLTWHNKILTICKSNKGWIWPFIFFIVDCSVAISSVLWIDNQQHLHRWIHDSLRVTNESLCDSTCIISFLMRQDALVKVEWLKTTIFTHRHHVSITLFIFCGCHYNRLRYTFGDPS